MSLFRKKLFILLLLLGGLFPCCRGEVFSLWPFRGGGAGGGQSGYGSRPEAIFQPETLRKEPVVINGRSALLECALGEYFSPEEALRYLRREFPSARAAMNKDALLFEGPESGGFRKKFLFLTFPGMEKGLLFTMRIPAKGFGKPSWPSELPFIPGMRPQTVISFPERRSIYGQAASSLSPQELLSHLAMEMKAQGWISPGREHTTQQGSGDVFFRRDSSQLMIFGVLPMTKADGSRESIVTIYSRKLR